MHNVTSARDPGGMPGAGIADRTVVLCVADNWLYPWAWALRRLAISRRRLDFGSTSLKRNFPRGAAAAASDRLSRQSVLLSPQANRRRGGNARNPARVYRPLTGWQEYAHALLLANEASFVN